MYEDLVMRLREHGEFLIVSDRMKAPPNVNVRNVFAEDYYQGADAIEAMCEMVATAYNELANVIQSYEESKPRWIPVTERLPEESEGLNWHEDMMIRFTSVWCCDVNTGCIEVRNRLQGKKTGNWHWCKSWWEPTHWMPIVPLPEQPKEET